MRLHGRDASRHVPAVSVSFRDRDHFMYEATIEDPKVFSRPWKIKLPLYRRIEENAKIYELKCVEFAEEVM